MKRKLNEEGLFDPAAKQILPAIPSTVGIITSSQGAALRDIRSVLERRWPRVQVYLFPSSVQGTAAPAELRTALDRAIRFSQSVHPLDTLILTRGGGSAEDLAAFNDEGLARDIYACPIPLISAVGHEIDFSISDFVADCRAPTPSAAAELAVPDRTETRAGLVAQMLSLQRQIQAHWKQRADALRLRAEACLLRSPQRRFETYEQRLDLGLSSAIRSISSIWKRRQEALRHGSEILRLSDPSLPLHRGYSFTYRKGDSRPLRTIAGLEPGESIETRLADGRLTSTLEEVRQDES
jgi:exodeoxyribonuclease VII large subunit